MPPAKKKPPSLDLHGRQTDEVFDLIDRFVTKHDSSRELLIIVGKGRGLVKKTAIEYLRRGGFPWRYETAHGKENQGALIVDLS